MAGFAPGAGAATAAKPFPITIGQPFTDPNNSNVAISSILGIYVGATGNVQVQLRDNTSVTFTGVPAGFILPVVAICVIAAGTTAGNLVGLR